MSDIRWTGPFDSKRRPHGRGTLRLSKHARYEGRLVRGARSGLGSLVVTEDGSDEDGSGGSGSDDDDARGSIRTSVLRVQWADDVPHGRGSFVEPDGSRVIGEWQDGELCGLVREDHVDGSLRFLGHYAGGVRCGEGIAVSLDGGCLVGSWRGGSLHGHCCAYLYPCSEGLTIIGEWRHGRLHRGRTVLACDEVKDASGTGDVDAPFAAPCAASTAHHHHHLHRAACNHPEVPRLLACLCRDNASSSTSDTAAAASSAAYPCMRSSFSEALHALNARVDRRSTAYCRRDEDEAPLKPGGRFELRPEPYEQRRVHVRLVAERQGVGVSGVPLAMALAAEVTAGEAAACEGLFASRPLMGGEVVAFFGGERVAEEQLLANQPATDTVEGGDGVGAGDTPACTGGGAGASPGRALDFDWAVPTSDGWIWLPPALSMLAMARTRPDWGRAWTHAWPAYPAWPSRSPTIRPVCGRVGREHLELHGFPGS